MTEVNCDFKFHVILIFFGPLSVSSIPSLTASVTLSALLKVTLVQRECLIVPRDPDATLLCVKLLSAAGTSRLYGVMWRGLKITQHPLK